MNILSNYPDIISTALIPMIIAIFALGFPLLIQTISRIDDKYQSTKLIETFRKDMISKWFLWILLSTIASYIIWICQIPPLVKWGWLIDNSALILIAITTVALIIMIFFIVYLTYVYYVPEKLLERLIKKHDKTKDNSKKTLYFEAISKILFYSINKADENLARTLLEFYYSAFIGFRKNKEGEPIEYPQEYYDTVFEANELLCNRKKKTISSFNDSTIFGLFLDQFQKTVISPNTYIFLWKLIVQSILYDRKDFVLSYWRKAHQLFNFFMQKIYPKYDDYTGGFKIKNQAEIEKRDKEREDFLEFHYVLGGLLMFKQKYDVIEQIMNYTQQQPPKYVLVPEGIQQVIERYMQIDDKRKYSYYEQRYQFPDIYGVNADDAIRMWIKRYLAILFIRQYTRHKNNILITLQLPNNLSELNRWKEELDSLKNFVNEYLSQENILKELGFEKLYSIDSNTDKYSGWFENNNKIKPSDLIENFKKEIEEKFNQIKKEQPVALEKEKEFQEKTVNHLKPIFEKYSKIFTSNSIGDSFQRYCIGGQHSLLEKEAFSNNQSMGHINTNTITAQAVDMQFQYSALNIFTLMFPTKYFLTKEEVFLAINRLNINSDDFIIIAVGLDINYLSYLNIKGLEKDGEKWYYNKMEIVEIDYYMNDLVTQSLFILKKEDLPKIIFKETTQERIDKYHLDKIDDTYDIYAKIIDLNKDENKTIREEISQKNQSANLLESVLVCVDINVEIQCKKNAKCIQLKAFSQFDDRGKAIKSEDVKSIWDNIK